MTKRRAVINITEAGVFILLFVVAGCITIYNIVHGCAVTIPNILAVACTGYTAIDKLLDIWALFPDYMRALKR